MEIEEKRRIEEGKEKIAFEEIKVKSKMNEELKEVEKMNFKKKTDNVYMVIMESMFVLVAPFVILSLLVDVNWVNLTLTFACILLWLGIYTEEKAIVKEQESRKEQEKENVQKSYSETLEKFNEMKKEFLTEEEKEAIRREEAEKQKKEEEIRREEEKKQREKMQQKIEKERERERKRKKFISTLETIGAVARVLNMILDVVLCIVFLPLGLFACFLTAVARSDNKTHRK
ncbi:MAG: hypothetical protein IJX99_01400 [Clostridia bacterium]|nr:hypothetical protein [Clostridia bacterium]